MFGCGAQVPCTYNAKLPYANGDDGPDAYIKGIVTLDDGATCVSDVLTVDPKVSHSLHAQSLCMKSHEIATPVQRSTVVKIILLILFLLAMFAVGLLFMCAFKCMLHLTSDVCSMQAFA